MIKVGDKEFPCRLTMGAMLQFKRTVGKDVSQMNWKDMEELLMLMWCCVSSASRADNIEFPIDFPMFCDLVSPADIAKWNSTIAEANEKKREGTVDSESDNGDPVDVEHLLGIAMGCMGMSMDDFCRCTPSEYYAAYEAWHDAVDAAERGKWERVRMQCLCILQPYSKDKLKARDIMQFVWDKEVQTEIPEAKEELSREEIMKRYKIAAKRAGLH